MKIPIDLSRLVAVSLMQGEDEAETKQLADMLTRAERYVTSFKWCPPIEERYLGFGVGGVLAVFLFKFQSGINGQDEWLWVIEGDVPSAYFVVDKAPDPASALRVYCELMQGWVDAVRGGRSVRDLFPVDVPTTKENATALQSRLEFIKKQILPNLE